MKKLRAKNQESERLSEEDLSKLNDLLHKRREEVFRRVRNLQSGMRDVSDTQPEVVEQGQAQEIIETYQPLDAREIEEVREIDLAINKIADGTYGVCESCGAQIATKRLYAVPWTRFCLECSEDKEREAEIMKKLDEVPEEAGAV